MLKDRRKFHRWSLTVQAIGVSEDITLTGEIANLSFGGARVRRPSRMPTEGTDLEMTLHHKDHSATLTAHVFYVEGEAPDGAFGVEFYGNLREKSVKLLPFFQRIVDSDDEV